MRAKSTHKIYGIIGTDLKHTLSPMIHSYMYKKAQLDCTYSVFEIDKSSLINLVKSMRLLDLKGINVTYPFKEAIIKYLDQLDSTASNIKAVNVIKNVNGKLTGYNTDCFGIRKTITDKFQLKLRGKNIILLGAGGAARACLVELLKFKPANILIINRTPRNGTKMIKAIAKDGDKTDIINIGTDRISSLKNSIKYNLVVNAASANSKTTIGTLHEIVKSGLVNYATIFDMNYGNRALIKSIPEEFAGYTNGLYMLVAQAVKSFEIWHKIKIDIDDVYKYITRKVEG